MKEYRLTDIRQMEVAEVADPEIEKGDDVLLRVESVGVCGSDIHYYTTGRIGKQVVRYPFRVGHECSATVMEVGPAVSRVEQGDRVAIDPAISCGECDQCRQGRPHTCRNLKFLGCPDQMEGCLCEYTVLPEQCCYPIGKETTFDQAALIEPFSIGCYAVKQAGQLNEKRIAVLGAGPIGLSVLLAAQQKNPTAIYVTEPLKKRRALAQQAGAIRAVDPYAASAPVEIAKDEPELLDSVFECCGKQEALDDAIEMLAPGGTLMLIGIPQTKRISFSVDELRHREITIQNVRRQNECVRPAIDLVEKQNVDIDIMETHQFAFDQTPAAFDLVARYGDGVVKAMIHTR